MGTQEASSRVACGEGEAASVLAWSGHVQAIPLTGLMACVCVLQKDSVF